MNLRLQRRSDFESHALDHSATLSSIISLLLPFPFFPFLPFFPLPFPPLKCKRWGSNPRLRRDSYLKRAPWTTRPLLPIPYARYDFYVSFPCTILPPSFSCFLSFLEKRQWQDLNLRLHRRSDFESHALDHSATLSSIPCPFLFCSFLSPSLFLLLYPFAPLFP